MVRRLVESEVNLSGGPNTDSVMDGILSWRGMRLAWHLKENTEGREGLRVYRNFQVPVVVIPGNLPTHGVSRGQLHCMCSETSL